MPEDLLKKSREYAKAQGKTLNQLIQDFLKRHVEKDDLSITEALLDHAKRNSVSVGYKWNREDAYEK